MGVLSILSQMSTGQITFSIIEIVRGDMNNDLMILSNDVLALDLLIP